MQSGMKSRLYVHIVLVAALAAPCLADPLAALPQSRIRDDVFEFAQRDDGTLAVRYIWDDPATVYAVSVERGQIVHPGRQLCVLKIERERSVLRSKAHLEAGLTYRVVRVNVRLGQRIAPKAAAPLLVLQPVVLTHDSAVGGRDRDLRLRQLVRDLWESTGVRELVVQTRNDWALGVGRLVMMAVGLLLLYLAIARGFEPLLLVPIGFGAIMTNIPLVDLAGPDGILGLAYEVGIETGVFPLLIFMGVGAMTDFGPLIANPVTALLGAAAQMGIFVALIGSLLLSKWIPGIDFSLADAASIGIIGGADGPTAIFLAGKLSPRLLGAIAVSAYSYMALVPIIQPPLMRLLTTEAERKVKMAQLRYVTPVERICFPISITLLCAFLLPGATPLISMLMFGNLLRECHVVERLSDTAQNALINTVTIFLGLTVGSKLSADKFLNLQTLGILLLGLVAFAIGTMSGLLFGKVLHRLTRGKVNPLIGAAGVSAVPMAARVVNKVGLESDPNNFLLMHAMGPNVAGVIGSAVAAGVLLNALRALG